MSNKRSRSSSSESSGSAFSNQSSNNEVVETKNLKKQKKQSIVEQAFQFNPHIIRNVEKNVDKVNVNLLEIGKGVTLAIKLLLRILSQKEHSAWNQIKPSLITKMKKFISDVLETKVCRYFLVEIYLISIQ